MIKSAIITKRERRFNKRAVLAGVIFIATLLVVGGWFINLKFQPKTGVVAPAALSSPYAYDNPQEPIGTVALTLVYVVPNDANGNSTSGQWEKELGIAAFIDKVVRFYELQLEGRSRIIWRIVPEPVIGNKTSLEYGGSNTNEGNPEALLKLKEEIGDRMQKGEIRPSNFSQEISDDAYSVLAIIFQDVGLAGTEHALLLSDAYLQNEEFRRNGPTLFAHEFGHALGISDFYEYDSALNREYVLNDDIMGAGRWLPIEQTYVSEETKIKMGL
ncbi:MAG: hypothetical protein A2806_00415 [Candidatus Terrybacteria bacterium RIFCSPHIGHO2_01_FULL_48_17]|uniref:Uncharacterized protein n=1 Tax=Candidatus Terrybacteria bacterium RIFCSPHIGHO2_01_FULL_48_17 TaxID=1802362 RepID=A0A1G2PJV8_9BACT|nr:MAG: hypothetical protein A2806_00415 [Candidatus Terrybacteria bacterium RIFCSPHIGHO2_01_FULL_48_17]OHA53676.1 MAG: hypothetical protein A3A30_00735 [Candidatus Terrybacteria bacterium RIFCSPLOWO2_01_FULL_48_14]